MADHTIVVGDIVQLKSGGPHMTVISVDGAHAFCQWFDNSDKVFQNKFPTAALDWIDPNRSRV